MATLIQLHNAPVPWKMQLHPAAYSEAGRAVIKALPGISWIECTEALNGRGYYEGPIEACELAVKQLQVSRIATVKDLRATQERSTPLDISIPPSLYPYQRDGVRWLVQQLTSQGSAWLADEMGLGKTPQAIVTAIELDALACVVVCPAVVVRHWEQQIIKWGGNPARFVVRSYEKFTKEVRKGTLAIPSVTELLVVFDEAHYLSNHKSQRSQAAAHFVNEHSPMVLLLSGTPITARIKDLHQPLNLMHPGRWGSKFEFEKRYADGHWEEIKGLDRNVWVADGHSNMEELHQRLRAVMLRRTKDEVQLQLPTRIRTIHEVEMPARARKALARAAAAVKIHENQKQGISSVLSTIETYKIDFAIDLATSILDGGGKPLILTLRKDTAYTIGGKLMAPVVTGDDEASTRAAILQGASCGVATLYSVTTGIDLTNYDSIIMVGLDWLPSTILQGEARIHRIGSKHASINIHYLIGLGTADEQVREVVLERLDTFAAVIGNGDESAFATTLGGGDEDELISQLLEAMAA